MKNNWIRWTMTSTMTFFLTQAAMAQIPAQLPSIGSNAPIYQVVTSTCPVGMQNQNGQCPFPINHQRPMSQQIKNAPLIGESLKSTAKILADIQYAFGSGLPQTAAALFDGGTQYGKSAAELTNTLNATSVKNENHFVSANLTLTPSSQGQSLQAQEPLQLVQYSPNCTPGIDCAGPNNGAPGSPSYQPMPQGNPDYFPSIGNVPTVNSPLDNDNDWHGVFVFGSPQEQKGNWSSETARSVIERGETETKTPENNQIVALQSDSSRNIYRLYWRYVGSQCDPNDPSRCAFWNVEYRYFLDRTETGSSSNISVEVRFKNSTPLLPWEKDKVTVNYDGSKIWLDTSEAAYVYDVRGPIVDQQAGRAYFTLTAEKKILQLPERDKVKLSLQNQNGQIVLATEDDRASFYNGETLEIAVTVKKFVGGWVPWKRWQVTFNRDQNGPLRIKVDAHKPTANINLSISGHGKYQITGWSFRRADSKISSSVWINEGKGNTIQY